MIKIKSSVSASDAYAKTAANISGMVSELQTIAERLHDVGPHEILWDQMADLVRIHDALEAALSIIKNEGYK